MSLSWSRITLVALALTCANAVAGSAYRCTAANGVVTFGERCPPGTANSHYLGDTYLPYRPNRDAYNPERADSYVRPGDRMGNGAPPTFQPQPNPRNGAMTPNYRRAPYR